jgi:DNA-binding NarL/FixJ family response regulator
MARTVLMVDDHAPFRALAQALLQLEGFEVVGEELGPSLRWATAAATTTRISRSGGE